MPVYEYDMTLHTIRHTPDPDHGPDYTYALTAMHARSLEGWEMASVLEYSRTPFAGENGEMREEVQLTCLWQREVEPLD